MPLGIGIASAVAPIIGGMLGGNSNKAALAGAQKAMAEAQAIIDSVGAPPDLSARIIMQKLQSAGVYTPEMEQAINLGVSKASQIQEDPSLKNAQMGALQLLQQRGKTGLGPEDRAALNEIRSKVAQDTQAKQEQIIQNLQARGMAGSGSELAARMIAAQQGGERASQEGDRQAAMASQNALQAIMQSGQLGGQIRGQDFNVEQAKANAADEFSRFNVQNQMARQERNVGSGNVGQRLNLGEKQRISDTNIGMENTETQRQNEAKRQYWQDQLSLASARAGARTQGAGMIAGLQQSQVSPWQQALSGVGAGLGAVNAYMDKAPATPASSGSGGTFNRYEYSGNPDNKDPYRA